MPDPTRRVTSCYVEGCVADGRMVRGLCKMHYARWRRHGDPGTAEKLQAVSWAGAECSAPDCASQVKALGLCMAHYKRFNRWGDPAIKRPTRPAAERFGENVEPSEKRPTRRPGLTPCHEWTAAIGNHGYGVFHPTKNKSVLAHRWAYEQARGPIPDGMVIDHLCRNRRCVNPDHLEPVTNEENLRRGAGYGLRNGMRNECIHGHEYTPENTYVSPAGDVRCRACRRKHQAKHEAKKGNA